MRRVELKRHVAADPASVALLLASADVISVTPPRRSGVGFVSKLTVAGPEVPAANGDLRIQPAEDAGCDIRIVLTVEGDASPSDVQHSASRYLSEIALQARSRSFAA
jgi:hypothetical protein